MKTDVAIRPVPVKAEVPSLKHRVCPCQFDVEDAVARCGLPLGCRSSGRPVTSIPAPEMCIVCHLMATTGVPCKFCGKPANL